MVRKGIGRSSSWLVLGASALSALLAGCAAPHLQTSGGNTGGSNSTSSASPQVTDDTPARPTAVQEILVSSTGIAGFFPFEGTTVKQTRADMQRDETSTKATGAMSRFVLGTSNRATITRIDRKLVWQLDPPKSQYTECPLTGCPTLERQTPREERQPSASKEQGCTMRIARNTFDVHATGMRQVINGFGVEQYQAQWLLVLEDAMRRQSTSKLEIEMWTTPPNAQIRAAQTIEASFARASSKAAPAAAGLPPDMQRAMQQFLAQSLSANERSALFNLGREFDKIKGLPIKTTMGWAFGGNACGGTSTPADGARGGGVMGMLGALTGGGSKPAADAPLFSITTEVKRYQVEAIRDSQFNVPAGFRRTN